MNRIRLLCAVIVLQSALIVWQSYMVKKSEAIAEHALSMFGDASDALGECVQNLFELHKRLEKDVRWQRTN